MVIASTDLFHLILLSVILMLAGGDKVRAKPNLFYFIFSHSCLFDQTYWIDSGCVVEALAGEHPETMFEWDLCNQGK